MASCRPSATSARAALAAALLLGAAAGAYAQAGRSTPAANAHGNGAIERLRAAREGQMEQGTARGPSTLPTPSDAQRRRAFEAFRKRQPAPPLDARARAALEETHATQASEREAMARRIGQALGLEAPDVVAIARSVPQPLAKSWVPVVFASSSMPVATLRTYAAQLERTRGVLAFRGMPGGLTRVAPMAKLSAEVLRIDPGCEGPACAMRDVQIIVDPLLFRQHAVTRVPALTMVPGDPAQPYCEREETSPRGSHLVLGDAALSGLLEEYARLGGKEEVGDALTRF